MIEKEYLTTKEVAKLLQVSVDKLVADRKYDRGIPYVRIGSCVRYYKGYVEQYLKDNTVTPNNDYNVKWE